MYPNDENILMSHKKLNKIEITNKYKSIKEIVQFLIKSNEMPKFCIKLVL